MLARFLVVLSVTLGIALPHGAAALAVADSQMMVICTGDGLRTIRIGAEGQPAEVSEVTQFCALAHATDKVQAARPAPAAPRLLFVAEPRMPQARLRPVEPVRPSLPRAPPAA